LKELNNTTQGMCTLKNFSLQNENFSKITIRFLVY